jgi:hypothetical protein
MKLTAFIPHLPAYGCRRRGLPALELKDIISIILYNIGYYYNIGHLKHSFHTSSSFLHPLLPNHSKLSDAHSPHILFSFPDLRVNLPKRLSPKRHKSIACP